MDQRYKNARVAKPQAGILLVGLAGLEPATFRPPDGRATRLRHSPTWSVTYPFLEWEQGVNRTFTP